MSIPLLDGVVQWLHILAAALAVGGVFFLRFVLCPSLKSLPAEPQVLSPVARRFKMVVHSSIAVLILTGVYRLIQTLPLVREWKSYHAVLGIKLLLALALFTIAIALTLPGSQPNYFQRNRDRWLSFNFILGALILLLSAILRRMWN
jgi:uncharacterized membrane protein